VSVEAKYYVVNLLIAERNILIEIKSTNFWAHVCVTLYYLPWCEKFTSNIGRRILYTHRNGFSLPMPPHVP
jgi:hypothetical protein